MMRVASPVGGRIADGGGQMHNWGFEQVGFHSFGLFLPVNWSRKRAGSEYARPSYVDRNFEHPNSSIIAQDNNPAALMGDRDGLPSIHDPRLPRMA